MVQRSYSLLRKNENSCQGKTATGFSTETAPSHQDDSSDSFGTLKKSLEKCKKVSTNKRVVRIKKFSPRKTDGANVFGKLSDKDPMWYPDIREVPKIDNDQTDDSTMVRNISRWYRDPTAYLEKMKTLVKEKRLKDALDLFVEMKRNFVVPQKYHFTFMIGACGRAGYTEMAFKLLRQMTDRGMKPSPATLTGLFNSCGESPYPEYGLKKAKSLKEKIEIKNWEMNQITYHAMIKAFGRCGDIETAFQIVDEMAAADIKIDVSTYSFLLMSCVEDKKSGFTHAIEVWRKMKERKCMPNVFTCNLLLRAVRDCSIGPDEISCLLLQHWSNYLKRPYGFKRKEITFSEPKPILQIESSGKIENIEDLTSEVIDNTEKLLNSKTFEKKDSEQSTSHIIEAPDPSFSLQVTTVSPSVLGVRPEGSTDVLDLKAIKTPSDRMALLGGAKGFLEDMKKDEIKPSIKTFTLLLESLPPYFEIEEELITLLDIYNVSPDIGFFNILMKRRIFRHEGFAAKQVLELVSKWGLCPDVITFGVLATGCRTYSQALTYLNDLKNLGFCPNIEIAGALLANACTSFDLEYLQHILVLMQKQDIKPNERLLRKLDKTLQTAKKNIIDMEHGKKVHQCFKRENFSKLYKEFCEFYDTWLPSMKFENEENVWSQYKTEIVEKIVLEPCKILPRTE
ncbi:pentatricopeptide repeat-containing protein 1, mitochondrial [Parasteatoda tepidariorum]|uniref:pentatricopeptide repeat-containing protein 1, mitochondrial n=1 Tax=Parasteatoda tepidariorum TaxID=114398 RepID=UPI0039BD06B7